MVKSIRIINTISGTAVSHGEQGNQFSNNIINSITGSVFSKRGTSTQKRWLCCNRHRFKTQKTHNNINRISTSGLVSEKPKIKQGLTLSRSPRVVPPTRHPTQSHNQNKLSPPTRAVEAFRAAARVKVIPIITLRPPTNYYLPIIE